MSDTMKNQMPELKRCSQPTKHKWLNGEWVNEPGKCGNMGRFLFEGRPVCGKHYNLLTKVRPESELERMARALATAIISYSNHLTPSPLTLRREHKRKLLSTPNETRECRC